MIHDILSSDVDFAKGMMDASHSEAEILAYLASRGIEPAKAAQLVDDLRHDRKPDVQLPFVPRPGGHDAVGGRGARRRHAPQEPHASSRRSRGGSHKQPGMPWWFLIILLLFLWALGYAWLETGTDASKATIDKAKHEIPAGPGKDAR